MLGLDLPQSGVYNPQIDHGIYRAPELDREKTCCFREEDMHGVRVYHEAD